MAEVPVLEEDRITIGGAQAWDRQSARLSCAGRVEPRRVSRRLLILRGWSHDEANPTLFP